MMQLCVTLIFVINSFAKKFATDDWLAMLSKVRGLQGYGVGMEVVGNRQLLDVIQIRLTILVHGF